jgi:hypothetical protein
MIRHSDKYRFLDGSRSAMIRAAQRAARQAKEHKQPLLLWSDGQVVRIDPDTLPELPEQAPLQE